MAAPPVVVLRIPTAADEDLRYRLESDLDTWEERNPGPPVPVTRAAYDARQAEEPTARPTRFVIEADGEAVGSIGLFGVDDLARHAEIGLAVVPEARGRGIGTAAVALITAFAFDRCNLRRVHLQAIASNTAAIRAYTRAGFVEEGRLRQHAWVRGGYEDIVLMGALRDERAVDSLTAVSTPPGT